ncbi:MAG TPA: thioredoxin domain-containing protein [Beijerinckiaceae bacterium]|nr:thioredoxin domain-containing protein [Beijerinckiaceae bacterium]
MNRLANATSPYLLQHKDNPVAWQEWGPDAFAEAQSANKPILLSVGYAACHWCHVMAHESFEDPDVAALMNELFVNIKVDREERPDVDHVYMNALHILGEQGGWPLTMFLTPAGEPFWGGTYFPKEPAFGRPGFSQVLREVARVFHTERHRIDHNRALLTEKLREGHTPASDGVVSIGLKDLDRLGARLVDLFDRAHGGIKGAPKFPNPTILEALYRYARRSGDAEARDRALVTLERMARGGIHDHLGGGFARYSVDERWLVPHFEKMLYDNAQLLELYAVAAQDTGSPLLRSAAEGVVAWLEREMLTGEGAFASSLDADTEGEEGRFYVWSLAELRAALGDDADLFAQVYDVSDVGNWEHTNILNRLLSGEADPATEERLADMRTRLLARRAGRVRPGLDDKILADWNGLMIAALVRAALALDQPDWIKLAQRAFGFIVGAMAKGGQLGHSWRAGALVFPGFALDHAAMMRAAIALHEATGEATYLDHARTWRDSLAHQYRVPETGLLAMTAANGEDLIVRPQPIHDDAVPNANGVFAEALVRLAAVTGSDEDRRLAGSTLAALATAAAAAPLGHMSILNALDLHLRGVTIIVVNDVKGTLRRAALRLPCLERVVSSFSDANALPDTHPAKELARTTHGPRALVCGGMRCSLPVAAPEDLARTAREMLIRDKQAAAQC